MEAAGGSAQLATERGDALLRQYVEQRVDAVIGTDTGIDYYRCRPSC
ncbi:hypothetical protein OG568_46305 [Streptomyces sp. NBC_01450]|nr:hypothetical protein [Streptomyces sp. NBC_01450]